MEILFNLAIAGFFLPFSAMICYRIFTTRDKLYFIALAGMVVLFGIHVYIFQYYMPAKKIEIETAAADSKKKRETVVMSHSVGNVVRAEYQHRTFLLLFSTSYTTIETTKGFYKASGAHSLDKGQALKLELRGNGQEYLCYESGAMCMLSITQ